MKFDPDINLSLLCLRVLGCFIDTDREETAGSDIMREIGIASGSLYPMLAKLEQSGWLRGRLEPGAPREKGRPNKRLYKLTRDGRREVKRVANQLRSLSRS
jgi:DNA-binding PadR family transcriptional regulator